MKKKFLLSFLTVLTLFIGLTCVNAATAKAPSVIPGQDDTLYGQVDETFDFSKIKFTTSKEDNERVAGKSKMQKIILAQNYNKETQALNESWFSAYCLNPELKYPKENYVNYTKENPTVTNNKTLLDEYVKFALYNKKELKEAFKKALGMRFEPEITYTLPEGKTEEDLINTIKAGNDKVTVYVTKIVYTEVTAATVTLLPKDLGSQDESKYTLEFTLDDILFSKFITEKDAEKTYNHALWIIEHSYPTLGIEESLEVAGANYNKLLEEVKALHTGETLTDEQLKALAENYVYSTIQYAIWKANNMYVETDVKLGKTLEGSEQLNTLYGYLIADRDIYTNYGNLTFSNTIDVVKPEAGKEVAKETKDAYLYGPYSISYDVLSVEGFEIKISGDNKDAIKLIDESGAEVTKLGPNQKFYIQVTKSSKIASLKVEASTINAYSFNPSTDRGRIYYSYTPLAQDVISGGKIVGVNIQKAFEFAYNPKTGVTNIAILFAIVVLSFTVAYVVINSKNTPIELN